MPVRSPHPCYASFFPSLDLVEAVHLDARTVSQALHHMRLVDELGARSLELDTRAFRLHTLPEGWRQRPEGALLEEEMGGFRRSSGLQNPPLIHSDLLAPLPLLSRGRLATEPVVKLSASRATWLGEVHPKGDRSSRYGLSLSLPREVLLHAWLLTAPAAEIREHFSFYAHHWTESLGAALTQPLQLRGPKEPLARPLPGHVIPQESLAPLLASPQEKVREAAIRAFAQASYAGARREPHSPPARSRPVS